MKESEEFMEVSGRVTAGQADEIQRLEADNARLREEAVAHFAQAHFLRELLKKDREVKCTELEIGKMFTQVLKGMTDAEIDAAVAELAEK